MVLVQRQVVRPVELKEEPEMKSQTYGHLIFVKETETIKWKKEYFQQMVLVQQALRSTITIWDLIKLNCFCKARGMPTR